MSGQETTTGSGRLEAAAELLEELCAAVDPVAFYCVQDDQLDDDDERFIMHVADTRMARPLASWLRKMAAMSASSNGIPAMPGRGLEQALAVADALLAPSVVS